MEKLKQKWLEFADKNPKIAAWVREGGLFLIVSNAITLIRGFMIGILENIFSFMGDAAIGFPNWHLKLFGVEFDWYLIGASHEKGGVAYFVAFLVSLWICEIINFFMQRKFVFPNNGNAKRQFVLYFLTFVVVTCIVNAISNLWIGVASHFLPSVVCDLGTTFLTGGVAMVVFFFANRFIFKDTEKK